MQWEYIWNAVTGPVASRADNAQSDSGRRRSRSVARPAARATDNSLSDNSQSAALPPYSIDGRQYIAVPTGWGGWLEGFLPGLLGGNKGDALFVFALPEV